MAANEPSRRQPALRLFFALWPEEDVRGALAALTEQVAGLCGGRPTAAPNLHVTLAFLGHVPAQRLDDFIALADGLEGEPFDLHLDTLGYWRRARIAWAGAAKVPPALVRLADDMKRALERLGWPVDERPYEPHVTLSRDAERNPGARAVTFPPWRVSDFVLVRSTQEGGGPRYTVLRRWPLGV
jgi:2'-5' RNA ligase